MLLINQSNSERLLHMLYAGLVQILLSIISFLLIIFFERDYNIQLKKQVLKLGMLHSQNEIEQIERNYTNARVLKHDMKHLLGVILSMLKCGEYSTAEKEIETIIGKQLTTDIIHMQSNTLINAVVNNKINICKENDILYEVKLIGDISKEQEMNVAVILSNLIDNAIEAELKETERIIKLDMFPVKDMYSIVVSNKLSESVLYSNAGLKTTKEHVHEHGFGKISVDNLVNQMHGIYKYYEEDGYFITTILFSNNEFVP
jgi:sensor histidine kinase regulating citrate/malate metabolism